MSQVLVGEIVFKLKADANNMVRALREAAREVDKVNAATKDSNKSVATSNSEMNKSAAATAKAAAAMRENAKTVKQHADAHRDLSSRFARVREEGAGMLSMLRRLLIVPAVTQAVNLLVSAVGSLAVGAFSLVSALAPLSGALVLYPALFGAVASAMGVVKLAMAPVAENLKALASGDIRKINDQLATSTPLVNKFALALHRVKESMGLSDVASGGMLPGMLEGLEKAAPLFDRVRSQVFNLSQEVGGLAARFGALVGSAGFLDRFNTIGAMNQLVVRNMGGAFISLFSALSSVMAAGAPFVVWVTEGIEKVAKLAEVNTEAARKSGKLAEFFESTARVGKQVVDIVVNLAAGLRNVSQAGGSALGQSMIQGLVNLTDRFREFTGSVNGQNQIGEFFRNAAGPLREFGRIAGELVSIFGRLATGGGLEGFLVKIRTDLLPALEELAANIQTGLGPALVDLLTAFVKMFNVLSTSPLVDLIRLLAAGIKEFAQAIERMPLLGPLISSLLAMGLAVKILKTALAGLGLTSLFAGFSGGAGALGAFASSLTTAGGRAMAMVGIMSKLSAALRIAGPLALVSAAFAGLNFIVDKYQTTQRKMAEAGERVVDNIRKTVPAGRDQMAAFRQQLASLRWIQGQIEQQAKFKAPQPGQVTPMDAGMQFQKSKSGFKLNMGGLDPIMQAALAGKSMGEQSAMVEKWQKEVSTAYEKAESDAMAMAMETGAAYKLLTGATVSLGETSKTAAGDLATMQTSMSGVAKAAFQATMDSGNLLDIFNNAKTTDSGKTIWSAFMGDARKVQEDARQFSRNITKAIASGYDPALIVEIASQGPKAAGGLLDGLVKNASAKNVQFFNSYSETMKKIAFGVAEQARLAQKAVLEPTSKLTEALPEAQSVAAAFSAGAQSLQDLAGKTGLPIERIKELAKLFGMDYVLRANVQVTGLELAYAQLRALQNAGNINAPDNGRGPGTPGGGGGRKKPAPSGGGGGGGGGGSRKRPPGSTGIQAADGGIISYFANGGFNKAIAQFASAGAYRMWAEPETGGEAYIPLSMSKRARSREIWKQTGRMLGMDMDGNVGSGAPANVSISVNAQTNADPYEIAREAAWMFRSAN